MCVEVVNYLETWSPPLYIPDKEAIRKICSHLNASNSEMQTCLHLPEWIRIVRGAKSYSDYCWYPSRVDIIKSSLFRRLRSGKQALASPPPTAYSYPWYNLIDQPERAHWARDLYVQKTEEGDIAYIAQCPYLIHTYSDKDEMLPFSVSFGPYFFRTIFGPMERWSVEGGKPPHKLTIYGWWIKYVPNPLEVGAFDLEEEQLPYRLGQLQDG
jgi:hypothetical protein